MASYQYKVANPPPMLALVNPKGGEMATKKKTTAKKPAAHHKNAAHAKKAAPKKHRSSKALATRNPTTVTKKKTTTRKSFFRNPISSGVIGEGLELAGAGIAISFGKRFIQPLVGSFVGASPAANAGVTLGAAYGLGFIANLFGITRKYKKTLELAGWTLAGTQLAVAYVLPALNFGGGAAPAPAGMNGPTRMGMRGIGVWPGVPSGGGQRALPSPSAVGAPTTPAAAATMKGIGVWPGVPSGGPR